MTISLPKSVTARYSSRYMSPLNLPAIPTELLSVILFYTVLPTNQSLRPFHTAKERWSNVSMLSRVSREFRALFLREWFRTLYVRLVEDWNVLELNMSFIFPWVRELHCAIDASKHLQALDTLPMFPGLKSVTVDFSHYFYPDCCEKQCTHGLLESLPRSIEELGYCSIDPVDTMLLNRIIVRFSGLRTLQLSGSSMVFDAMKFPLPKLYKDGKSLGTAFGKVLSQLRSLTWLSLDIHFMPQHIRSQHALQNDTGHRRTTTFCHACKSRWSEEAIINDEMDASMCIASSVPTLKCIEWPTWFGGGKAQIVIERKRGPSESHSKPHSEVDAHGDAHGAEGEGEPITLTRTVLNLKEWSRDFEGDPRIERSVSDSIAWGTRGGKFEDGRRRRVWYW